MLDRVVINLQRGQCGEAKLDTPLLLTALSLTLNSTIDDREMVLYKMKQVG